MVDKKITRVCQGELSDVRVRDCFVLRAMLPTVIHQELNEYPFSIAHGDLGAQNIIVDSSYTVTGSAFPPFV